MHDAGLRFNGRVLAPRDNHGSERSALCRSTGEVARPLRRRGRRIISCSIGLHSWQDVRSSARRAEPGTLVLMAKSRPVPVPRAELVVAYASRHGNVVAVLSTRGMLLARWDCCSAWTEGVRVHVSAGEPVAGVAERLIEAHNRVMSTGRAERR